MSIEPNIFHSTAKKTRYNWHLSLLGQAPVLGLGAFFINRFFDESLAVKRQLTPNERMATHYFRWRDLTCSLASSLILFFIMSLVGQDIDFAIAED